jgi:tRNA threonylcarbamoyladenosine biosynthesis protein TsaE
MALYLLAGLAGLPVFTTGAVLGATAGYLLGFIAAALVVGRLSRRSWLGMVLGMVAGEAIILLSGATGLCLVVHLQPAQALAAAEAHRRRRGRPPDDSRLAPASPTALARAAIRRSRLQACRVSPAGGILPPMPPETSAESSLPTCTCERPTEDAEATRELARRLARKLQAGDFLALIGELGAGKTTFAQGLAQGLGVRGRVSSPTFVLMHCHSGPLELCHLDAYRVSSGQELREAGAEEYLPSSVVALEWADRVPDFWPPEALIIELSYTETGRRVVLSGRGARPAAIVQELCADDSGG